MKNIKTRYRYSVVLLRRLVITDFKLRYQGSLLGYTWSLLRPLALFVILYIVFARFLKIGSDIPNYPIYLLLGIVLWNYFVEATTGSISAIVSSGDLIRKINFPKYVIILAGSFSALINLFLNLIVVGVFIFLSDIDLRPIAMLFPLFIGELFIFSLAMAFFLSAVFVKFRDIGYIWDVLLQGAFYATPILYPLSLVPIGAAKILILSPISQIIQDSRYILIYDGTLTIGSIFNSHIYRLIPVGIVLMSVVVASSYFRARSKYFAEEV